MIRTQRLAQIIVEHMRPFFEFVHSCLTRRRRRGANSFDSGAITKGLGRMRERQAVHSDSEAVLQRTAKNHTGHIALEQHLKVTQKEAALLLLEGMPQEYMPEPDHQMSFEQRMCLLRVALTEWDEQRCDRMTPFMDS
jgi:hypothetical protein